MEVLATMVLHSLKLTFSFWLVFPFRTYPFIKTSFKSTSGSSHRSLHSYSFDYTVSVLAPSSSLINCLDNRLHSAWFQSVCMHTNELTKLIIWITFLRVSVDLWTLLMHSYGGIEPIFQAIESFPPLPVTLVEHMIMNSTQIFPIGCSQCPSCTWGLGHHSVLCWQCVQIFQCDTTQWR